ncbi:hypothetical protein L1049_027573 [Liquidambar formosana]|uniref:Uncharacterized protein n=1 Tax=Liquidambar formosana TaxID=63359 RepID=A0AAP0RHI4_LIQFO
MLLGMHDLSVYVTFYLWWCSETIAVVTGGNRGIGFEIAHQLAVHGLTVILTSRDSVIGEEATKVLREGGLNVVFHQLDVLDPSSIKLFSEWTQQTYGGIDILVNNAGINFNIGSENSVEFAQKVVATNYYGTKSMIQDMIPLMKPSASGARIVNVSSRLGRLNGRRNVKELIDRTVSTFLQQVEEGNWAAGGWPQMFTDYSVAKLAVNAYTRLLAKILSSRPEGQKIYINCYCPGWVKTAMTGWAGNISAEDGADTGVWLALLPPDQPVTGKFFAERRRKQVGFPVILQIIVPNHWISISPTKKPRGAYLTGSLLSQRGLIFPPMLLYRSKQRGFLELDLVLGRWVEEHICSMDEQGIKALAHVLDLENPDLWKWLTGQEQPPDAVNLNPVFLAVRDKVMNNLNNHAAPETRAVPGQPWVRGWDDFKKGRDSPISGNQ